MIVLDRPFSCADKYPIVSTIDDSAKGEWKVLLRRNTLCNNAVNSFSLFLLQLNAECLHSTVTASSDYVNVSASVDVSPGETTATQRVITKYNSLQETNEIFKAMLSLPDGLTSVQLGENNTAYVTICDSASECAVID